jgi:isopentenyldiphosphate isomerase
MNPQDSSPNRFWYGQFEGYESRCQKRLKEDLGLEQDAAEMILNLRRQMVALQSHIYELETELVDLKSSLLLRLDHNRDIFYEATWIEVEFQE